MPEIEEKIHLIYFSSPGPSFHWSRGRILQSEYTLLVLNQKIDDLTLGLNEDWILFWDFELGPPPSEELLNKLTKSSIDVWHAGLRLGMNGLPGAIDFVMPTWMFNCDPPLDIEAASWRLTLQASLIRVDVIKKIGWLRPAFKTLEAATLEMGHRWITRGVLMRYIPQLIQAKSAPLPVKIPFEDELRFIHYCFEPFWKKWTLIRAILSRAINLGEGIKAWRKVQVKKVETGSAYYHLLPKQENLLPHGRVSVLIPTVDRYAYLRVLLDQLRNQTIRPLEIIVIDQTDVSHRDFNIATDFQDLPLKIIYQENPGQCSSRNKGLRVTQGEYILFLDDDDEIPQTLIENHLRNLKVFHCEASSGIAEGMRQRPFLKGMKFICSSDVFPTSNTLIRKEALQKSGLFDLAYDRRSRADADLGMRVYLSGAMMILDPAIVVKHHHALSGGLRIHGARVMTYEDSRRSLLKRHLLSASELYWAGRYFTSQQIREMVWMRVAETLSIHGSTGKKILKFITGFFLLPHTLYKTKKALHEAENLREDYPQISFLNEN